jgi:hypothetical protein
MVYIDYTHVKNPSKEQTYYFYGFVSSGLFVLLTLIICVLSTIKCLKGNLEVSGQHERTVYIIALPAFYGLMCFLSAEQVLYYKFGTVHYHWSWIGSAGADRAEKITTDMITFYMSAADVFEAFALSFFAMLTMESLKRFNEQIPIDQRNRRDERLQSCIQSWTMSPIYMFCVVLSVESCYHFVCILLDDFHLTDVLPPALVVPFQHVQRPDENAVYYIFFTLKSIFSSFAIMALFSIDHVFADDLAGVDFISNHDYRWCKFLSNLKFWGVKIFVTLEFTLEVVMMPLKIEEILAQMMQACFMAFLCFVVALIHVKAYAPRGKWIADLSTGSGSFIHDARQEPFAHVSVSRTNLSSISGESRSDLRRQVEEAPEDTESARSTQEPEEELSDGVVPGAARRKIDKPLEVSLLADNDKPLQSTRTPRSATT